MSSPKSTAKSVKRRGLAIATAVAVAGSGIVGVNYVSAQETENDQAQTFGNPEAVERDTVAFTDDVDFNDVNDVEVNKVDAPSNSDSAVNSGPGGVKSPLPRRSTLTSKRVQSKLSCVRKIFRTLQVLKL